MKDHPASFLMTPRTTKMLILTVLMITSITSLASNVGLNRILGAAALTILAVLVAIQIREERSFQQNPPSSPDNRRLKDRQPRLPYAMINSVLISMIALMVFVMLERIAEAIT